MFFAALMILAATACTKQEINDSKDSQEIKPAENVVLVPMSFSASGEEVDGVRATIDNSGSPLKILWESSDAVKVYDNIAPATPHDFSVTPGTPATAATLEGEVAEGSASFYAVYPAAAAAGIDGGILTVTVPAAQVIPSGKNIDPAAIVSVASAAKGDALSFKNVCGFLALEVSYANIQSITVTGTKIAGSASVAGATGVISSNASATNSITLTYEDGLFPLGVYYIALLPGETAAGDFVVDMTQDVAGFTATRTATSAVDIPRKGGFDFGKLDSKVNWTYLIGNAADMVAWKNRSSEWQATDVVRLTADIDMNGVSWIPTTQHFFGTFDGKDPTDGTTIHKIYNLTVTINTEEVRNACFINHMRGTFRNVIIGSSDGTSWDGTSAFTITGDDDGEWHYAGVIGRHRGSMSHVTSFANVVLTSSCEKKARIGGIVGVAPENGATIDHCYYKGAISALNTRCDYEKDGSGVLLSSIKRRTHIGGIVGCIDVPGGTVHVTNCINSGSITSNDELTVHIGGVVGFTSTGTFADIDSCDNEGTLTFSITSGEAYCESYVGGIAGGLWGNNTTGTTVKGCKNKVAIAMKTRTMRGFGGIVGCANSVAFSNKCENSGKLSFTSNWKGSQLYAGGIVGWMVGLSSIDDCHNHGDLDFRKNKVQNIGGIAGAVRSGVGTTAQTISNCSNDAALQIYRTAENADWQACGGIVGQFEKTSATLTGNTNSGSVKIQMPNTTTHAGGLNVGGIVGVGYNTLAGTMVSLSGNTNTGSVTLTNSGASTMKHSAGGIAGRFLSLQSSSGDTSNCTISYSVGGTATGGVGAAVGYNEGTVTNPVLGGSVAGEALTAGNVADLAIGSGTAATGVTLYVAP